MVNDDGDDDEEEKEDEDCGDCDNSLRVVSLSSFPSPLQLLIVVLL